MTLRERLRNVWRCFDFGQAWFELWYRPRYEFRSLHSDERFEVPKPPDVDMTGAPRLDATEDTEV